MTFSILKRCPTLIATLLITASQTLPVWSQTQQVGYYPAPELANVPGLIYDPPPDAPAASFSNLPGATSPGWINVEDSNLSYDPNRAWPTGATPDRIIKFGDLKQNPQFAGFTKHSLRDFNGAIGTDIGGVPISQVELVNGLNLEQVKNIYNNGDIKLKDSAPLFQAVVGAVLDPTGAQKQLRRNALGTGKKVLINKLNKNPTLKDIPFEDLLEGDWQGALLEGEQVLLREIGDDLPAELRRLPVGSLAIEVIEGNWDTARQRAQAYAIDEIQNFTLNEVIKEFPELKQVPIGGIVHIANQPLDQALPQLADLALEKFPGIEDKILSSVPGLSDTALGSILAPVILNILAGDIFGKFDIAHSGQDGPEEHYGRPISGGTPDAKFKTEHGIKSVTSKSKKPKKGFPRFEMAPLEPGTTIAGDPLLGKEWMSRDQEVPGCKGFLCLFGKTERAGIKPFGDGSLTKFSLGEITEFDDKPAEARLWVDFQICVTILFEKHCTAHIFSFKTPWKVKVGGIFPILARRKVQDYFPGINEKARTIDFCQAPDFLGGNTTASNTAGSSSPPKGEAEAFAQFQLETDEIMGVTFDRDDQGRLLIDETQDVDAVTWVVQEAGTYGFETQEADDGTITFNYTGVTHPSPALGNPRNEQGSSPGGKQDISDLQAEGKANGIDFQPVEGASGAPRLDGIPGQPNSVSYPGQADDGHNQRGAPSTPSDPQHNLRQYLARIALGESSGGRNIAPNSDTGAYGEYQFIPKTRQTILDRHGVDAWSENKAERDQAAVALIQDFGGQVGTDIIGLIEAGNFNEADRLLGQHSGQRSGQFTSLPGGAEQHDIWNDPAILAQYGPNGDAGQNPLLAAINTNSQRCDPTLLASNEGFGPIATGPDGDGISTGQLTSPIPGGTVTSEFGHRPPPCLGCSDFHQGIDIDLHDNSPIFAADGGVVVWSRVVDGYGNYVLIDHGNGLATWYAHNSQNLVLEGQKVEKGRQVAIIGATGNGTGVHLDFGVIEGYQTGNPHSGTPVNPRKYVNF